MTHSTLWLAQIQFFSGFSFMLLFLVLTFGLAWVLVFFRIRAMRPDLSAGWIAAYRFWVRAFALAYVLGFAAALPVLIQLGSLWPQLMEKISNVAGPMLVVTILSMFVFKSCFLGPMLFGLRRLSKAIHTVSVVMMAVGVSLSTFFLISIVAWMHTPQGAVLRDGRYVVTDMLHVLFSPALPWYGLLFVSLSLLSVGLLMMAVVAGQAPRRPVDGSYPAVFKTALMLAAAGLVLHAVGQAGTTRLAAQHQPAKAAAMAGYWQSGVPPDLVLAAWPDANTGQNRLDWTLKNRGASWLGVDQEGVWRGLDQFSGMTPPVALTFWSFRVVMITWVVTALFISILAWRARTYRYDPALLSARWRGGLKVMVALAGLMVIACAAYIQFGAFPYAVYEAITLSEVMASVSAGSLLVTIVLYGACYGVLLAGFLYLLRHSARFGVIPVARRRRRA